MSSSSRSTLGEDAPQSRRTLGARSRTGRAVVCTLVAGMTVTGLALTGAPGASGAEPLRAQSVGRLVDGTLGGNPIQQVADVADARATAPGTQSVQNPLDATLLGQLELPLTGVIDLPTDPAIVAGAVNQVAVAHLDGFSYGAAGAVSNSGGANLGGSSDSFPALGTINLTGAAVPGLPGLPGAGDLDSLGGITAKIGAVAALAQTAVGGTVTPAPQYAIAGLDLTLGSPALGGVLTQLAALLNPAGLPGLPGTPISLPGATIPTACMVTTAVLAPISFAGGGVSIDPGDGTITISLAKLLAFLGSDINGLPANTDLLAYLLNYLSDPDGLAKGLKDVLTSITQPGQDRLTACLTAISQQNAAAQLLLAPLVLLINSGSTALQAGITQLTTALSATLPGGSSPLAPLADGLKAVIDIGVNVESGPGIQPVQSNPDFLYTTALAETPNQATPVVPDQTLVRALEINILGGLPSVPDLAASIADPSAGATIALGNAAVGPSSAAAVAPTTAPTTATVVPTNTTIPTGVPAGYAKPAGSLDVPLLLLIVGLVMAGGGAVAWKYRGRHAA